MKDIDCQYCENSGVTTYANGEDDFNVGYCICEYGALKEYQDKTEEMSQRVLTHITLN